MKFDPQTVAQAKAFVNALRAGKRARVPALRFSQWQPFLSVVNAETGYATDADCGLAVSVYPALGLAEQETAACGRPVRRNHVTTEF